MTETNATGPLGAPHLVRLRSFASSHRMVFVAGLPGVGKSLLLRELAEEAHRLGRRVHVLQWDVARRPFDAPALLARYPEADGITHPVLRRAAGLWARDAVAAWAAGHDGGRDILVGETPLIGHRFVELARPADDGAEAVLSSGDTAFLLPVPTVAVRQAIESARAATTDRPRHERERADAVPGVLRVLWGELLAAAGGLAEERGGPAPVDAGYDPELYVAVFSEALAHRNWEALSVDVVLPPSTRSVYSVAAPSVDLAPTETEAGEYVARVEREYPDLAALERETAAWWRA